MTSRRECRFGSMLRLGIVALLLASNVGIATLPAQRPPLQQCWECYYITGLNMYTCLPSGVIGSPDCTVTSDGQTCYLGDNCAYYDPPPPPHLP